MIPDTDSVSWVIVDISAVSVCMWRVYRSRREPTARVANTKSGIASSVTTVSCHDSRNIATSALAKVIAVREDRRQRRRHRVLGARHVRRQPRLEIAGARAGEERQRERLQVAVEPIAELAEHELTERVGLDRLDNAERPRGEARPDHDRRRAPRADRGRARPGPKSASSKTRWIRSGLTTPSTAPSDDEQPDDDHPAPVRCEQPGHATPGERIGRIDDVWCVPARVSPADLVGDAWRCRSSSQRRWRPQQRPLPRGAVRLPVRRASAGQSVEGVALELGRRGKVSRSTSIRAVAPHTVSSSRWKKWSGRSSGGRPQRSR